MAAMAKGLGKGLSALMNDNTKLDIVDDKEKIQHLPLESLVAGKYQPRSHFSPESLQELADSIRANGVLQPILVRRLEADSFEIIAGERRFRAAKIAGLADVPVILHDIKDGQALEIALIENIQRQELNPLEEAVAYARLMEEFHYTQEALAKTLGKSRSHIANMLRLNQLPEGVKQHIREGRLTMGHARALAAAENPEALAEEILRDQLNVRAAEALVAKSKGQEKPRTAKSGEQPAPITPAPKKLREKDHDILQLEAMLSDNLGLKVAINTYSAQTGEVVIAFESLVELDGVLRRLGGSM